MRALLWAVVAVAALWAGYWVVGSRAVERAAANALAEAGARGLTVTHGGLRVAGFPNRFDLTVTAPRIVHPASGYGWQGDAVQLLAMTWKPWHLIALFPLSQRIVTPQGDYDLTARDLRGSVLLTTGRSPALRDSVLAAGDLVLTGPAGRLAIASASFATEADPSRRHGHRIGLRITDLTPDMRVQRALPDLPAMVSGLHLDAHLLLAGPLDRAAIQTPPAVTGLVINSARLDWGPLQMTAQGSLAPLSGGTATGRIDLRVENWRLLPDVLGQTGLINPVLAPTLLRALEILAEDSPDPAVLETALTFTSGLVRLGPLPVGPGFRLDLPPAYLQ